MRTTLLQLLVLVLAGLAISSGGAPGCGDPESGERPDVLYFYPNNNATGVRLNQNIIVDFSKPMDRASTEAAFEIEPAVPGVFTWNTDYTSLNFQPSEDLQPNTEYTVTITNEARGENGYNIDGGRVARWTTGS